MHFSLGEGNSEVFLQPSDSLKEVTPSVHSEPPSQREDDLAFGLLAVWQSNPHAVVQYGCPLNESSWEAKGKEAYGISMCDALN